MIEVSKNDLISCYCVLPLGICVECNLNRQENKLKLILGRALFIQHKIELASRRLASSFQSWTQFMFVGLPSLLQPQKQNVQRASKWEARSYTVPCSLAKCKSYDSRCNCSITNHTVTIMFVYFSSSARYKHPFTAKWWSSPVLVLVCLHFRATEADRKSVV